MRYKRKVISIPGLGEMSTPESLLETERGPPPPPVSPREDRLLPESGLPEAGLPLPCLNSWSLLELEPGLVNISR